MDLTTYTKEHTQSALAAKLKVTPAVISQWLTGHRPVPIRRALEIERITNGSVTCEELRPDLRWARLPNGTPVIVPIMPGKRRAAA